MSCANQEFSIELSFVPHLSIATWVDRTELSLQSRFLPDRTSFHITQHQGTTSPQFCHIPASEELLELNTTNENNSETTSKVKITFKLD